MKKEQPQPKTFENRVFNDINIHNFKQLLLQCDFNCVLNSDSVDQAFEHFEKLYTESFNSAFPLKTVTVRNKLIKREPWATKGFINSSNNKTKLYQKKLRNPNDQNTNRYKIKLHNAAKRWLKSDYYKNLLSEHKHNIKETWKILNQLIHKSKQRNSLPSTFNVNDKTISHPAEIANEFNIFFANAAQNIINKSTQRAQLPPKADIIFTTIFLI